MAQPRTPFVVPDRIGDLVSDMAVWGLATWTVVYHLGRLLGVGTDPLLIVSIAVTFAAGVFTWRQQSASVSDDDGGASGAARGATSAATLPPTGPDAGSDAGSDAGAAARFRQALRPAAVSAALTAAAVVVHWSDDARTYVLGWLLSVGALVPLVLVVVREGRARGRDSLAEPLGLQAGPPSRPLALAASLMAWLAGAFFAYISLRTVRVDADDTFYVNKAVYVAENGRVPLRDTMYSDQSLPALRGAGTAPVQSIEVLQGAIAHLLGIQAGTVVYYVSAVVMSFLAVWSIWRLARSWSQVRALVALGVSLAYLSWGVRDGYGLGTFFVGRIWQGKTMFVCFAVPLAYYAITRWAHRPSAVNGARLLAIGITAIGLTSTATLVIPPLAGAAAVALLLMGFRRWWGPLLLAFYPVASGVVVAVVSSGSGAFGEISFSAHDAFHKVVGERVWGALGITAILLAPWLVRTSGARMAAAAGSVAAVVMMAPGMPTLVNVATGAGPILYRLMWIPAIPVLVGVIATAPWVSVSWPRAVRLAVPVLVPLAVVALIVTGGQLIWTRAPLEDGPRWKYSLTALSQADWINDRHDGPGPVLAPWRVMRAVALTTTSIHPVDPRAFYLESLDEPADQHAARVRLSQSMRNGNTRPPASLEADLALLEVGLVCLDAPKVRYTEAIIDLGWMPIGTKQGLTCYDRA